MRHRHFLIGTALLALSVPITMQAQQTIVFNDDPFAGTDVLTTPGRQVVGNEIFVNFDVGSDVFAFNPAAFGFGNVIKFASGVIGDIPSADINAVVLQTFDNDADPLTPFGAGSAANLLAEQITTSGAGVFLYFNSGLDLARLVFSTDLSDNTADLKILARLTNVSGQDGRDLFPSFSEDNFTVVPEPSAHLLLIAGAALLLLQRRVRNQRMRRAA